MKYLIGVQPTGKLHIGNYLGCIKRGLEHQEAGHDVTFMIANYHALTGVHDYKPSMLEAELKRLGCKNIVYQTPEYTELFFKLCCKTGIGTLSKMPQYKSKSHLLGDATSDNTATANMGLLLYPVLMTADIIINDPDVVIVGRDQVAHIDLCNDLAKRVGVKRRFNYEFGHVEKVYSLIDPSRKMSKSDGDGHVIYLFDEDYEKKLRRATATEDGLRNLRTIATNVGVSVNPEMSNLELKESMSRKMNELFNNGV